MCIQCHILWSGEAAIACLLCELTCMVYVRMFNESAPHLHWLTFDVLVIYDVQLFSFCQTSVLLLNGVVAWC